MSIEEFLFSDKTVEEYLSDELREPLTFDENLIKERWNKLFSYGGSDPRDRIAIFDSSHAEERLGERFPEVTWSDFKKIVADGLKIIKDEYGFEQNFYMIVSKGTNVKVQLDIRPDRNTGETIGVIATVLHAKDNPWHKQKEISVFVESENEKEAIDKLKEESKNGFFQFQDVDPFFIHYFENGDHYTSFAVIEVE